MSHPSPYKGFHNLSAEQRCQQLLNQQRLTAEQKALLRTAVDSDLDQLCQQFSENVLGGFALPFGVVPDVHINDKSYILPLAVEETSIVAGLCKMAKWIRQDGSLTTSQTEQSVMGQVYFTNVANPALFIEQVEQQKQALIDALNETIVNGMFKRGGGVQDFKLRTLHDHGQTNIVVDVYLNSCDAMGANLITQVAEYLKTAIEEITQQPALMGIVSNYNDRSLVTAKITLNNVSTQLGEAIEAASRFAEMDPHRAATHNKGIMNGMDAIILATGNDWRAVEAGCHAYAAAEGHYQALATWRYDGNVLTGHMRMPINVGIVGGVTKVHPQAQISLQLLGVESASELAQVIVAAGLMQNFAALNALVGEGIAKGHMRLHLDNLILQLACEEQYKVALKQSLIHYLNEHGKITLSDAKHLYQLLLDKS